MTYLWTFLECTHPIRKRHFDPTPLDIKGSIRKPPERFPVALNLVRQSVAEMPPPLPPDVRPLDFFEHAFCRRRLFFFFFKEDLFWKSV